MMHIGVQSAISGILVIIKEKSRMNIVTAEVEYVQGHLRHGHYEAKLTNEDFEKFKDMSCDEQEEYIRKAGHFVIDDYRIDDIGPITDVNFD